VVTRSARAAAGPPRVLSLCPPRCMCGHQWRADFVNKTNHAVDPDLPFLFVGLAPWPMLDNGQLPSTVGGWVGGWEWTLSAVPGCGSPPWGAACVPVAALRPGAGAVSEQDRHGGCRGPGERPLCLFVPRVPASVRTSALVCFWGCHWRQGDPAGALHPVHPPFKAELGRRANLALQNYVFGNTSAPVSGPVVTKVGGGRWRPAAPPPPSGGGCWSARGPATPATARPCPCSCPGPCPCLCSYAQVYYDAWNQSWGDYHFGYGTEVNACEDFLCGGVRVQFDRVRAAPCAWLSGVARLACEVTRCAVVCSPWSSCPPMALSTATAPVVASSCGTPPTRTGSPWPCWAYGLETPRVPPCR